MQPRLTDDEVFERGRLWATQAATPAELDRLIAAGGEAVVAGEPDVFGWSGVLYRVIRGDAPGVLADLDRYWGRVHHGIRDVIDTEVGARAFIRGALQGSRDRGRY